MTEHAMRWETQALWRELEPWLPGLSVEVVARTVSTNSTLLERARSGSVPNDVACVRRAADIQPCLLVAEHQTGGRGRQGRSWQSAPGASLTFSLAVPLAVADWSGLSLALGVALADALDPPTQPPRAPRLALKWPNDLWLIDLSVNGQPGPAGRKLGGILVETVMAGPHRLAVVGIGINILPLPAPTSAPTPGAAALAELSSGYACLQEIDPSASAPATLARIALPVVQSLRRFEREGFAGFSARFRARDLLAGRPVCTTARGLAEGVARGVSDNGALLLQTESGLHAVASGEISVRLSPAPGRVPTHRATPC